MTTLSRIRTRTILSRLRTAWALEAARRLQEDWGVDGEDLLNCRPCARLRSPWVL